MKLTLIQGGKPQSNENKAHDIILDVMQTAEHMRLAMLGAAMIDGKNCAEWNTALDSMRTLINACETIANIHGGE